MIYYRPEMADALSAHLYEYVALLPDCSLTELAALDAEDLNARIEGAKADIEGWRTCGGYQISGNVRPRMAEQTLINYKQNGDTHEP